MISLWPRNHVQDGARAFFRLRIAFGLIGILLPLLLAAAGLVADGRVQPTISDFFHTTQRDLLVGGLVAIGLFLAVHRGIRRYPGRWISPDLIALVAGLGAMGVAFFPNESSEVTTFTQHALGLDLSPALHYLSAVLLYLMMSFTCFFVYAPDAGARWEKRVYLVAGGIVWCTGWGVMILSNIKNGGDGWLAQFIQDHNIVYWDESLGVWAFSVSWLLKAVLEQKRAEAMGHLRKVRLGAFFGLRLHPRGQGPRPGSGRLAHLRNELLGALRRLAPTGAGTPDRAEAPLQTPVVRASLSRHRRVAPRPSKAETRSRAPSRRAG
jgi:hypothetical protein